MEHFVEDHLLHRVEHVRRYARLVDHASVDDGLDPYSFFLGYAPDLQKKAPCKALLVKGGGGGVRCLDEACVGARAGHNKLTADVLGIFL